MICTCGRYSRLKLLEEYTYFHFFFIPIFKWGRKYSVEARCCGRVFEVPGDYINELIQSDSLDINRLREIRTPYRICPDCNQYVDSSYKYCPYCGKQM
jgi:tRNA(Ile2) C34 agmatinyltransferase TiaS